MINLGHSSQWLHALMPLKFKITGKGSLSGDLLRRRSRLTRPYLQMN